MWVVGEVVLKTARPHPHPQTLWCSITFRYLTSLWAQKAARCFWRERLHDKSLHYPEAVTQAWWGGWRRGPSSQRDLWPWCWSLNPIPTKVCSQYAPTHPPCTPFPKYPLRLVPSIPTFLHNLDFCLKDSIRDHLVWDINFYYFLRECLSGPSSHCNEFYVESSEKVEWLFV